MISDCLDKIIPSPICELTYNHDYELLLKVMLSAQTTDKRVNEVCTPLFNKYDSLEKLNKLSIKEIEDYIKSIGMYKTKAKNFKEIVSILNNLDGVFPKSMDELTKLPGVGRKTANVVLGELYNIPSIAVDTHVMRVSKRLGLANDNDDVLTIEKKLMDYFPKDKWVRIHKQLVLFGRYKCKSIKPICDDCPFSDICKKDNKNV